MRNTDQWQQQARAGARLLRPDTNKIDTTYGTTTITISISTISYNKSFCKKKKPDR